MRAKALWEANIETARACLAHPFVAGLADGATARGAFTHYVGQDAFFLDAFARAYALCAAKAPDRASLAGCVRLLNGVVEEQDLHERYAARWDVDLAPSPSPATRAYTDFLLRVAALEPIGHTLAAMTPCMRLYAWLGQQLLPVVDATSPYAEWVTTYGDEEFDGLAATLEGLLDTIGGDAAAITEHYAEAMRLELAFFDSAHREGDR